MRRIFASGSGARKDTSWLARERDPNERADERGRVPIQGRSRDLNFKIGVQGKALGLGTRTVESNPGGARVNL